MALPKVNDWPVFRRHLQLLSENFPGQFGEWVLIGGGACWFYRATLERWADKDFPAPRFTAEEDSLWLSKDVDFMGLSVKAAEELFGFPFKPETHTISFHGIEVDFLEEGVKLTTPDALRNARQVRTPDFDFRVLDAAWLYAEKLAVAQNKARMQDHLHLRVLERFLKCEFCKDTEDPQTLDAHDWVGRARTVKTARHDFFTTDLLFTGRLKRGICRLDQREHRALLQWAKHHLAGSLE